MESKKIKICYSEDTANEFLEREVSEEKPIIVDDIQFASGNEIDVIIMIIYRNTEYHIE